jgi:ATP-dependent RNA helicase SUPV3L1/SUV3
MVSQGEAREQWRLLDDEARERLRALDVREGQRFLYVAGALAPHALERRCMLTALFQQSPLPKGVPREPAIEVAEFGGRDARAFGYEVIGTVALRIDVVERLSEALRHPHGAQQVHTLLQELRLEGGVRTRVLRELGGQSGGAPSRRRRRRRRGSSQAPAPDKRGDGAYPAKPKAPPAQR